jgi:aspartyl-tRNA synthetase
MIFIALADESGKIQCVWQKEAAEESGMGELFDQTKSIPLESVVRIRGKVVQRPEDQVSDSGDVEIVVDSIFVINPAQNNLPIVIEAQHEDPSDAMIRYKYRWLDLRREAALNNLKLRSKAGHAIRNFLHDNDFTEVETPTLFKCTNEGAREFIVPTRKKGYFYALTQSPQQFKQLLMAGGLDRYFQFARCYRDEDGRADRQPEFTQIDLEMAFVKKEDLIEMGEELVRNLFKEVCSEELPKFARLTYQQAMKYYGSDKPDLRYPELFIRNIAQSIVKHHGAEITRNLLGSDHNICALHLKGLASLTRKDLDLLKENLAQISKNITLIRIDKSGQWKMPKSISELFCENVQETLVSELSIENGDCLIALGGPANQILPLTGRARVTCIDFLSERNLIQPSCKFACAWIDEFPLFEIEDGVLKSTHHPFTAAEEKDLPLLNRPNLPAQFLAGIRSQAFDMVINGMEVGGGSIRIHNANLQTKIFDILQMSESEISEFSHLLEALSHGCPPHGGLAIGFDRLCAIICGTSTIREVLAFPKSNQGRDLLSDSPQHSSRISRSILLEYHQQQ